MILSKGGKLKVMKAEHPGTFMTTDMPVALVMQRQLCHLQLVEDRTNINPAFPMGLVSCRNLAL